MVDVKNQSINHSINQLINQLLNQSINQLITPLPMKNTLFSTCFDHKIKWKKNVLNFLLINRIVFPYNKLTDKSKTSIYYYFFL